MALTHDVKETVRARAQREQAFRRALLREAVESILNGDLESGKAVLRDYVNATVGFQNGARDDGATIAFDAPYLHDHLAIRIASAPSWLRVVPASGTVPAGTSAPVQATVDATGVFPGDYAATIRFGSDDPVTPSLSVPVTLHARGVPHLEVDPISIDFGNVFVGQSATRSLTIRNMGTDVLTVTSIGASAFS